jgi:hypothetical protein
MGDLLYVMTGQALQFFQLLMASVALNNKKYQMLQFSCC